MNQKFVICEHCGNIATLIKDSGVPMMCCGQKMKELVPGVVEASHEKHIPVFEVEDKKVIVKIGSIDHPMIPEHYIEWVVLQTKKGTQIKHLVPGQDPKVCFHICGCDEVEAVYAYCNLHGLWLAK